MREIPLTLGAIHFVGIGGIGMSGIAEVLHNLGYAVQGSDLSEGGNVARLRGLGVPVAVGHRAENLTELSPKPVAVVVISSAVKDGNPEVEAARARFVPVVRRADMLAELMRLKWAVAIAGTHGKTTTTSLVAAMVEAGGFDPTVINGGIINALGTNAHLGRGDWMVVEADESDGTFVRLPATVAIVTNIDPEHLDYWGDFERLKAGFDQFVTNLPFYGFAVLCTDHGEVQAMVPRVRDRRILTYGFNAQADVRALDLVREADAYRYTVALSERVKAGGRRVEGVTLPMVGRHNVQNSLAAIAVAAELGIGDDAIRGALARFQGVKRRFTRTGEAWGVTVIDDYGHHPVEIEAVLKAAREAIGASSGGRVVAVVQPHRYTRLAGLFDGFCACLVDADVAIVADVYAAGEAPIEGADRDALVAGLRARGHRSAHALTGREALAPLLHSLVRPGDLVVCLGAGSITQWAASLPAELQALGPLPEGGAA